MLQVSEAFPQLFRRLHNNALKVHDSDKHFDALAEADLVEVRIIAATQPHSITGTPSKTPEVMELGLVGGDNSAKLEWAKEHLGQELSINDVFDEGVYVDAIGVTKGYGWQGVIRRFGVNYNLTRTLRSAVNMETWVTLYRVCQKDNQTGWSDWLPPAYRVQQENPVNRFSRRESNHSIWRIPSLW